MKPAQSFAGTTLAAFLLALLLAPIAGAQTFAADPFFEHHEPLRHSFALRLMESRLRGIEALLSEPGAADSVEYAGELAEDLESDLRLLAGSLASSDPDLLERLRGRLDGLEEVILARDGVEEAVAEFSRLLADTSVALGMAELSDPPFDAAVIALLLLSEDGVAEAYEEAVSEDPAEFTLGWATLKTVDAMWTSLSDEASGQEIGESLREDIDEALEELRRLLPKPLPEGPLTGDPEDAEEPSHRVVALLERATDARLHPDRDLGQLVRHVSSLAEKGCDDLAGGSRLLGMERLNGAFLGYEYLEDLVGLMAPAAHEQVDDAFERLLSEGKPEGDGECRLLLEGLEEVRPIVGG